MKAAFTRREFVKAGVVGGALAGVGAPVLSPRAQGQAQAAGVTFQQEKGLLRLSNGVVELVVDRRNGYFRHIRNLPAGSEHKSPADGVWPFGLWLGDRQQPRQQVAEITAGSPQRMTYRFQESPEGGTLEMVYPSLVENATGKKTGVRLEVRIRFQRNWDYFIITAKIENRSRLGLTNFYAARGAQLTGDTSREEEKVTTCFFGTTPRKQMKPQGVKGPMTGGHPIYTTGWYDYQGQRGSIGMAYINRQGMMMMHEVIPLGDGVQQGWHMFHLKGYWHFEKLFPPEQQHMIYPLEPGATFTTDEWIIAPHQGDWHRMADIYRERYNQVFQGDYADYARAPQIAKDVHFWLATWLVTFKVYMRPEEYAEKVRKAVANLKVDPKRIGVLIHQGGTTWAQPSAPGSLSAPDFFPIAAEVGGTETLKKAIDQIQQLGVRHMMGYVWVMGNNKRARNYVPEAEAGPWIPDWNPPGGPPPCVDNSAWLALWRDKIAPQFREVGDNSVYFDMGPVVWGICQGTGPAHLHGSSTVGILTGSVRGGVRLSQAIRQALGPEGTTMMEASGDITGRWVDIWTAFAEPTLKYTWPDKIYFGAPCTVQGLNQALVYGDVPFVNFVTPNEVTKALESPEGDPKALVALRRYLELREKLVKAPGYPDGFRDDVGLTVSDPNLVAKAFRKPGRGITVVYYAKAPVQASITVEAGLLENAWVGPPRRVEVSSEKDEAGFFIIQQ